MTRRSELNIVLAQYVYDFIPIEFVFIQTMCCYPRFSSEHPLGSGMSSEDVRPTHFLVRLIFCLFAEDTGIFMPTGNFEEFIRTRTNQDGSDLAPKLSS